MLNAAGRIVTGTPGEGGSLGLWIVPSTTPKGFSRIPAGTFTMGSPEDEPGRSSDEGTQPLVTLTRSFCLQQTPVTRAQCNDVREWALASGLGYDMAAGHKGSQGTAATRTRTR